MSGQKPWEKDHLIDQVKDLSDAIPLSKSHTKEAVESLLSSVKFNLNFLAHHLAHSIFPSNQEFRNPQAPYSSDPSRQYLPRFVTSSLLTENLNTSTVTSLSLSSPNILQNGGKPIMNQSALHGFHVFEGLQLLPKRNDDNEIKFGYAFLHEKVSKLVDGILRIRFATHLLKANVIINILESISHEEAGKMRELFDALVNVELHKRRAEAESDTVNAMMYFIDINRNHMTNLVQENPEMFFYVRVEAQGGNRESIGQGPIGVGQSTLQILGQHAKVDKSPANVVFNPSCPPRMHTLAGPFKDSPLFPLLNNLACHHGNMGHQHLSAEIAQPLGSDMLMCTAEIDVNGQLDGPYLAETNFSNFAFITSENCIVFLKNNSATYGLMQHMARKIIGERLEVGKEFSHISKFEHKPVLRSEFIGLLEARRVSTCFVMGSMPAIRVVEKIIIDETLSGGSIKSFEMDIENAAFIELVTSFQYFMKSTVVWE